MKHSVYAHAVPALLALVVFMTVLPFLDSAMKFRGRAQAAIDWHGVEVITKKVKPGDVLEIVYSATINKQCPSDLRGFVVAPDGSVPIRLPTLAGGYTKKSDGKTEVRVKIPLPMQSDIGLAPLKSGEYIYRTLATRYCPDGVEDDASIPDAKFTLEVP
jgi:hypothetical protein